MAEPEAVKVWARVQAERVSRSAPVRQAALQRIVQRLAAAGGT